MYTEFSYKSCWHLSKLLSNIKWFNPCDTQWNMINKLPSEKDYKITQSKMQYNVSLFCNVQSWKKISCHTRSYWIAQSVESIGKFCNRFVTTHTGNNVQHNYEFNINCVTISNFRIMLTTVCTIHQSKMTKLTAKYSHVLLSLPDLLLWSFITLYFLFRLLYFVSHCSHVSDHPRDCMRCATVCHACKQHKS